MTEFGQWWDHVWTMGHDAVVLWWRVLPKVVAVYLLGLVLTDLCNVGAAMLTADHPWLALMIVSTGLVCTLSAIIICLRIMGRALGIDDEIPQVDEDRSRSVTHLVAVTLLPFLGIYATFDYVQRTANLLVANEIVVRGGWGSEGVLRHLAPHTLDEYVRIGIVLVVAYVARRTVDLLHEYTGFRPLGLLAALIEGFFMLVLIFTGTLLVSRALRAFTFTRLSSWINTAHEGFNTSLRRLHDVLPRMTDGFWNWIADDLWPLFTWAFGEPILWLAVAALVHGTHVLSFAEMWRKGEPLSAHLDENSHLVIDKRGRRRRNVGTRGRRVAIEIQEAFFGDIDDKYLPTLQSLRLILSGGLLFLGAYVLTYSVFALVDRELSYLALEVIGGRDATYWVAWAPLLTFPLTAVGETLRLALLAVAFQQALRIFRRDADPSAVRPEHRDGLQEVGA